MFEFVSLTAPGTGSVAVDRRTGRPTEVRAAGQRRAVTDLESIRDETAAYSLQTGPRRVFVVRAAGRRYRLTHWLGQERWTVEELSEPGAASTRAA